MKALMSMLALAYPLLAHAAVVSRSEPLLLATLALLAALVLLPGLLGGSPLAWVAAPLAAAALAVLAQAEIVWLPLYAPPVLITFFMSWVFGHTLARGRVPLIERLVRLLHAPDETLDPDIAPYARRLTWAWTVLFVCLGILNLALALFASPGGILELMGVAPAFTVSQQLWSLFANVLNYAVVGGFFALEYLYRRRRFPQQPYRNMLDFIRRAMAVGPRLLPARREQA